MNNYTNSTESINTSKHYLQHVNFDKHNSNMSKQYNKSPDHMAVYSLNTHSNPTIKPHLPVSSNPIINRNPYLNTPLQLKKEPPRYNISRNNANKQVIQNRQSQELLRNKTQTFKTAAKNQTFTAKNEIMSHTSSINKSLNNQSYGFNMNQNDHYSQTVDLGSISRKQSFNQSVTLNEEEQEELKQKIKYLQLLEYSIRQFQNNPNLNILKSFKENNRIFLVTSLQKINRLKDEMNRRNSSDLYTESDNASQQNFFIDDNASDSRTNSLKIQSQIPKSFQRFSKSRQKSNQKINEINHQLKIKQRLQKQLQQLKNQKSKETQSQKLKQKIKRIEQQSSKLISKNDEIKDKLKSLAFYDSWILMCDEAQGAKKTSKRLKQELSKRKEVIKTIKQKRIEQNSSLLNELNMKDSKEISKSIDNKYLVKGKPQKNAIGHIVKKQIYTNRGSHEPTNPKAIELPPSRAKSTNRFSN